MVPKRPSSGDKQFKGVRRRSWGKWVSEIRLPNTRARLWLGSYATAEQAARAFDVAVVCLRGKSATLNFPESPPPYAPLGLPHHQIQELAAAAAAAAHARPSSPTAQPGSDLAMPSAEMPSIPVTMSPETPATATSEMSTSTITSQGASTAETSAMKGDSQELLSWDEELLLQCDCREEEALWENSVLDYWMTTCSEMLPVDHYANDDMFATMADPHGLWSL